MITPAPDTEQLLREAAKGDIQARQQLLLRHQVGPANNNLIQGNLIGTNAAGTAMLPNGGDGILSEFGSSNNTIGGEAGNLIAFNGGAGVFVASGTGNSIQGNSIHDNGGSASILVPLASRPTMWATATVGQTTCKTSPRWPLPRVPMARSRSPA